MTKHVQLACAWSGLVALVVALVGFTVAGVLPFPPGADLSAEQTVRFYADDPAGARIGFMLASVGVGLVAPLIGVIAVQMLRMEGRTPILTFTQMVLGAVTVVALVVPTIVLNVAAFRPERDPEITQALTDLGFILFFTPVMPFLLQNVVIAVAVLGDRSPTPVLPRWVGWANLWIGFVFVPALMAYFFRSGPFAWQGVFVFWLGFVGYGTWLVVMSLSVRRAVLAQYAPAPTATASPSMA
ncbi:hypothetical protein [Actinomycetospora soli]|uniref:hypothetical protein n=1 Tax=Actinomycetospora soli TaxID=2893887 RepID=UPI001E2F4283|nr:hypothetical protein [Actinomycetospora soli]MCD2189587.1 hypothetical protein [Actinomycetospora soli]